MTKDRERQLKSLSADDLDRHIADLRVHIRFLPMNIGYASNKLIAETMLREAEEIKAARAVEEGAE